LHSFASITPKIYNEIADTGAVNHIIFVGVLFMILVLEGMGGLFFFSKNKRNKKDEDEEEESYKNSLLCRFVLDGLGRKIGESVSIDDDILIIKSGSKYMGIPLKHIEEKEKTLLVKGLVDFDKSEEMGEKWRRESFREIDQIEGKQDGF
jgi:hypothetical protein